MKSTEHWNNIYSKCQNSKYSRIERTDFDPILQCALNFFGNVTDKKLIDLGCGSGKASLFFEHHGANVISIDSSEVAINNLAEYCVEKKINNITPIHIDCRELSTLGKVDFVFGTMILHHIEPFDEFVINLRDTIKSGGKGFFEENNARSRILMWFRNNIVGKLWVPKRGDKDESPLDLNELNLLKGCFNVEIEYPRLVFFGLIGMYLLPGHFKMFFKWLDKFFYRFHKIRKYSYRQCLYLS